MNVTGNSELLFTCPHYGLGELDEPSLRCEEHLPYTCKKIRVKNLAMIMMYILINLLIVL